MSVELRLRGTGAFILTQGGQLPNVNFRIEQIGSGRTFLYCDRIIPLILMVATGGLDSFQGETADGQVVRSQGGLNEYIDTPKELCFVLRSVEVGKVASEGTYHSLSLANFHFPTVDPHPIAFPVVWGPHSNSIRLIPRRNYQKRLSELVKTGGILPTTTLRFRTKA